MATRNEIRIAQGEDRKIPVTVREGPNITDPLFDLTDHVMTFTMKQDSREPTPLILKTSADIAEIEIRNQISDKGVADLKILSTDTKPPNEILPDHYFYDIWITNLAGEDVPVIKKSDFKITPRITQL